LKNPPPPKPRSFNYQTKKVKIFPVIFLKAGIKYYILSLFSLKGGFPFFTKREKALLKNSQVLKVNLAKI
jgi:hypothetical protein